MFYLARQFMIWASRGSLSSITPYHVFGCVLTFVNPYFTLDRRHSFVAITALATQLLVELLEQDTT